MRRNRALRNAGYRYRLGGLSDWEKWFGTSNILHVYSTRKVISGYTGSCLRVRRSSDNAEQDIGFDSTGWLDTSALATFVGGANTGYVPKWYDQCEQIDVVQTSAAYQPRIINTGTVETLVNGQPALRSKGVSSINIMEGSGNSGLAGNDVLLMVSILYFWGTSNYARGTSSFNPQSSPNYCGLQHLKSGGVQAIRWQNSATVRSTGQSSTVNTDTFLYNFWDDSDWANVTCGDKTAGWSANADQSAFLPDFSWDTTAVSVLGLRCAGSGKRGIDGHGAEFVYARGDSGTDYSAQIEGVYQDLKAFYTI